MKKWGAFLLILSCTAGAQTPLDDVSTLYKMSQAIQGVAPSAQDQTELAKAQADGQVPKFFRAKSAAYLKSPNHAVKMAYRFSELFRVKVPLEAAPNVPTEPPLDDIGAPAPPRDYSETSLGELFTRVAKENLPTDELAVGRNYRIYMRGVSRGPGAVSDFGFFQRLAHLATTAFIGSLADESAPNEAAFKTQDVHFESNDAQIAGAITTTRFFERYANSQTNHNRRRAAALYRIYLCDEMSPVVPGSESHDPEIVKLLYPAHAGVSEKELAAAFHPIGAGESLHGSQALCISCHQKLDPVGHVFDTSPIVVAQTPSPGALVLLRSGRVESTPVQGFAELGRALVAQPEYKTCQVRRFWTWFIGENIPLEPARLRELTASFDAIGHRTNDFIQTLVTSPEFRYRISPSPEARLASDARHTLQRCADCHEASPRYHGPDLTAWPLRSSTSGRTAAAWVEVIGREIDLHGHGEHAKMPPREASWHLSEREFASLSDWIAKGAPDEFGKRQVPE